MKRMILVLVLGLLGSALALSENSKVEITTETQPTYSMLNESSLAEADANVKRLKEKKAEAAREKEEMPVYQRNVSPK